jgi:hypothetical protein
MIQGTAIEEKIKARKKKYSPFMNVKTCSTMASTFFFFHRNKLALNLECDPMKDQATISSHPKQEVTRNAPMRATTSDEINLTTIE